MSAHSSYELCERPLTPDDRDEAVLWHIAELGRQHALCGHTVIRGADAPKPVADLAGIDPDRCCASCERIYRAEAAQVLDAPAD